MIACGANKTGLPIDGNKKHRQPIDAKEYLISFPLNKFKNAFNKECNYKKIKIRLKIPNLCKRFK